MGVGGAIFGPFSLEPLKHLGLDPQKVTKLAVKLHAHSVQYAYKLVSTRRTLEKTLQRIIIRTRNGVLLFIPLIHTDFFCLLSWWRSHTVLRP